MIVALYARYSSDNQREESIVAQFRACREYCKRKGYSIIHEYADEAYSGTNDNRPQFQQMMADAEAGMFEIVVAHKIDRIGRNAYDFYKNTHRLQAAGVKMEFAAQEISDSPEGGMMKAVMVGMSEWYSANLSREVKKGKRENLLAGKAAGGIPLYGYDIGPDKKYVINEAEAVAVRMMFEMYASGQSYQDILRWLDGHGYKTKRGKSFGKNSLYDLMHNRRYIGWSVGGKHRRTGKPRNSHAPDDEGVTIVKGVCPVIVSEELFERVQERMEKNRRTSGGRHKAKEPYLLSGYVFCDVCGGAMAGGATTNTKGVRTRYYRCETYMRKGKTVCANRAINADDLERAVLDHLRSVLYDEGVLDTLVEKVQGEYTKLQQNENASAKMMTEARDKARKQLDNFYNRIREGGPWDEIDEAEFQRTKEAFRKAEHNLQQIEKQGHLPKMPPAKIRQYIQDTFGGMINEKSTANYRALLENFIDSVRVSPSTVTIRLKVRCSWCARNDAGGITFIIDAVIARPSRRAA